MSQQSFSVDIKTDASGDATVYANGIVGPVYAISVFLDPLGGGAHSLATGAVDITFSDPATGLTLLTLTNIAADGQWRPRVAVHDTSGVAIANAYTAPPVTGRVKIVVAQGGATKTGRVLIAAETSGIY